MRRRPAAAHRAFALATLASLLTVASCSRGKEASDSTAAAGAPAPAARSLAETATPGTRPPLPGELAKPLAEYSGDEFYTFVHGLGFGGGDDKPRKCKGALGCDAKGGKLTSARVDAVDGQDDLPSTSLPANGVVAARTRNTGAYEEARYGLRTGAAYEYYAVVLPADSGGSRWSLQQLVTTPGARTRTEVATGRFSACPHTSKGNFRANFYSCSDAHIAADSTVKMSLMLQAEATDPIWVRCIDGCCTMQ